MSIDLNNVHKLQIFVHAYLVGWGVIFLINYMHNKTFVIKLKLILCRNQYKQ